MKYQKPDDWTELSICADLWAQRKWWGKVTIWPYLKGCCKLTARFWQSKHTPIVVAWFLVRTQDVTSANGFSVTFRSRARLTKFFVDSTCRYELQCSTDSSENCLLQAPIRCRHLSKGFVWIWRSKLVNKRTVFVYVVIKIKNISF